ncbi:MAG: hypothetical protein GY913_00535 [Proteobacteria bacterium]|nr:hypothetical protein [Pseudomonadota bacterium]MCP4915383.1 hypothetical protein [Pseudomonadota bacterium]
MRRVVLVLVGVCAGLVLGEVVVRLSYEALPSGLGLAEVGVQRATRSGVRCGPDGLPGVPSAGSERLDETWVIGDSMIAGHAVPEHQRVPELLGDVLGWPGRNLGMPGADHCVVARRALEELERGVPRVVVVSVFADDLDTHELVRLRSERVGVAGEVPWLAESSWLVNLAWYGWRVRTAEPVVRAPEALEAFLATTQQVDDRFRDAGVEPLWMLLEPVGRCEDASCSHFEDDGIELARLLDRTGVSWLDLRKVFTADHALPDEPFAIHPNAAGNAAVVAALVEALPSPPGDTDAEDRAGPADP